MIFSADCEHPQEQQQQKTRNMVKYQKINISTPTIYQFLRQREKTRGQKFEDQMFNASRHLES